MPAEQTVPRDDLAVIRERARLVRLLREQGLSAALAFGGLSRRSLLRCTGGIRRGGSSALVPERRGPRTPRLQHPVWVEQV